MTCSSEDLYKTNDGRCCDQCAAGSYIRAECDTTKKTECGECLRGFFTATKNFLTKCRACKDCSSYKNQRKVRDCTAQEDTVCECVSGFYCNNDHCDHCMRVKHCPLGEGVRVRATRSNDTVCALCGEGTYSNVTDYQSTCKTHTRCEDIGRVLKTAGTSTADAICGDFKSHCHWMLPAGLWSGLVLTALLLLALICWRTKRKSRRAGIHSVPVTLIEMVPAELVSPPELPLPFKEQNGHCTESCIEDDCKLQLFTPDDNVVSFCTEDSMNSSLPITPLKVTVSFAESNQGNGNAGYGTGNFLRTYSEPQEDEWCGTETA
uniref:tumor necrosis factor receptor superfamily member 5 n=1 Tax=Semicossyphus pulcher TaxID=241346 RepID=UPI0037E97977